MYICYCPLRDLNWNKIYCIVLYCIVLYCIVLYCIVYLEAGPLRGSSAATSVRGPESQEGACEFLKSHIALVIDVLFKKCSCFGYFQLFLVYLEPVVLLDLESSACPRGNNAVLFRLAWTINVFIYKYVYF
jgi:hypothetical protein